MSRDDVLPVLADRLARTPHRWPEVRMPSGAQVWRGGPGEYRGVQPGLASTILALDEQADVDSIIFGPHHLTAVTDDQDQVFFLGRCTGPLYTDYLMDFAAEHSSASQVRALKTIVKNSGILTDNGASR